MRSRAPSRFSRFSTFFVFVLALVLFGACDGRVRREASEGVDAGPVVAAASSLGAVSDRERVLGFARAEAGTFVGFHLGPRFTSTIDARGARLAGLDGGWTMGLRAARIGRAGAMRELRPAGPPASSASRLELARGDGVTEWFANAEQGLEHGLDLAARPAGVGELVIEVTIDGRTLALDATGTRVVLRDPTYASALAYDRLIVKDADGREIAASMTTKGDTIAIRVQDAGARYPLVVDPLVWGAQQAKLVASDGGADERFGNSVAIDGTIALVGVPSKAVGTSSTQGTVYVFAQSGGAWTQQAKLVASDGASGDQFGFDVALSGTTALVGAYRHRVGSALDQGAAYVFVQSGGVWTQQARLLAADGTANDKFGVSVALSGATALVGAFSKKNGTNISQGAAYVFVQSAGAWTQEAKLVAADGAAYDSFGTSVALGATTAIVGANGAAVGANSSQGAAYVFARSGATWTPEAKLVAADGAALDLFGTSVALSGATALVGANRKTVGSLTKQGAAYVFGRTGVTWSQQAKLVAADGAANDQFGVSVALSGTTALIGASRDDVLAHQGGAYVFTQSGAAWLQQAKLAPLDRTATDEFGYDVGLTGGAAFVSAFKKTVGANSEQGAAYVFVQEHANGDPCATSGDCVSGFCVDGVCCDAACTGTCKACTALKKGAGVDGSCGFIADGADPDLECPGSTCAAAVKEDGHVCSGAGACRVTTTTACAPYACDAAGKLCSTTCVKDECAPTHWCSAATCVPKKALGAPCTSGAGGVGVECKSGFCAPGGGASSGVCCDLACTGTCEGCTGAATGASDGTCAAISDGKDPRGDCPGATCAGAILTNSVCNGAKACRPNTASCAPVLCRPDGTGCLEKTCASPADCDADHYCAAGGTCMPRKDRAAACSTDRECVAGAVCADGVCCDRPCGGQCEACAEAGTKGTCVSVPGVPRGVRAPCASAGTECGGVCDGLHGDSCGFPKVGAVCGDKCKDDKRATCDTTGACGAPLPCAGSLHCATADTCKSVCSIDADCIKGFRCDGAGKCIPTGGSKCSVDGLASTPPAGDPVSCSPYRCDGPSGICLDNCANDADCADGNQCTSARACVPKGTGSGEPGSSGGCDATGGRSSAGGAKVALLTLLALLALVSRSGRARAGRGRSQKR